MKVKFKIFSPENYHTFFLTWDGARVNAAEFATGCEGRLISISQFSDGICVWYWD